jgi:hypothetical protein
MTADQAAQDLAAYLRKLIYSPHSELRHTTRSIGRRLLAQWDNARKRMTGLERVLHDDEDELPGAVDATSTLPKCKFCDRQFRPKKKGQRYCSTECRKEAFYERQRRIRHKDKPVLDYDP